MSKRRQDFNVQMPGHLLEELARGVAAHQSRELRRSIDELTRTLESFSRRLEMATLDFQRLIDAAARRRTADDSIIAAFKDLSTQLTAVSEQLKALQDAGTIDTSAVQAQIDNLATASDEEGQRLADAVKTPGTATGPVT